MTPFWWACCNGVADAREEVEARLRVKLLRVTILGDRNAADEFHNEVRAAGVGGACIVDLGDIGVIHHGKRLTLSLEACDHLPGIHAEFDDLERDSSFDGPALLGDINEPKPTFADEFEQLVAADHRAGLFVRARGSRSLRQMGRRGKEFAGFFVCVEHGLDFASHGGVAGALVFQKCRPPTCVKLNRTVEYVGGAVEWIDVFIRGLVG